MTLSVDINTFLRLIQESPRKTLHDRSRRVNARNLLFKKAEPSAMLSLAPPSLRLLPRIGTPKKVTTLLFLPRGTSRNLAEDGLAEPVCVDTPKTRRDRDRETCFLCLSVAARRVASAGVFLLTRTFFALSVSESRAEVC